MFDYASILGGIGSFIGASSQADAAKDAARKQNIALKDTASQLEAAIDAIISDVRASPASYAGSRVQGAAYQPTTLAGSQSDAIGANAGNLEDILALVASSNRSTLQGDMSRAQQLFPQYNETMGNLGASAASLSAGQLPFDAIQDIISGRQTSAGNLNTPGGYAPATLRDLGMNSLQATQQGASMFQNIMQAADQFVSPVSRQTAAPQFFASPQESTQLNLQQAQLGQQSQQNMNNLQAQPDPAANLLMQLQLQQANSQASIRGQIAGIGQPVVPSTFGIAAQTLAQPLGNALGSMFSGGSSGGYSQGYGAFDQPQGSFNPYQYNAAAAYDNQFGGQTNRAIIVT